MTKTTVAELRPAELRQLALQAVRDADPDGPGGVRMQATKLLRDRTRGARHTLSGLIGAVDWARQQIADPDPLREFAEWVVSLDGDPLLVERPTPADMKAIITRAREALDGKRTDL